MEEIDVNAVLKIYLGSDSKGGYDPVRDGNERLKKAYPRDYGSRRQAIERYLPVWRDDYDSTKQTLSQATDAFADMLRKQFPELEEVAVRTLANRWSYHMWK